MTSLLVVGATGLVGGHVLAQACADPRISRVIALTRRPIPAGGKLENVVVEFADLPARAPWWAVDGVVSALGTTRANTRSRAQYRAIDHDYPLAVARCARDHGATRFALTSSLGANPRSRFAYPRLKGELELALQSLGFPSLTIVRPSVLDGRRENQRCDELLARTILRIAAPLLPARLRASPAHAIAALLVDGAVDGLPGVHVKTNENIAREAHP